uniref:Kazal-like domain-containing protein n=1 Tax=Graphocephala atropunctata TaxID=36148 RepID=A0A1B6LX44_9HEMI
MTPLRFAASFLLLQVTWQRTDCFCYYSCPRPTDIVCGVDKHLGAKLFRGTCLMLRLNHCSATNYRQIDTQQCLEQYPEAVQDFISSNGLDKRFDRFRAVFGTRPLPRYIVMYNVLLRMALGFKPWPVPIYPPLAYPQLPIPFWPMLNLNV